jgi:hypothetical protein
MLIDGIAQPQLACIIHFLTSVYDTLCFFIIYALPFAVTPYISSLYKPHLQTYT